MPDVKAGGGGSGRARPSVKNDDAGFSFEQVMKNNSLPPCSLNDFMDYLLYVEHKAENLQFFLWYCDYIERWSKLLPRQKLMSPAWDPEKAKGPSKQPRVSIHKRSDSDKLTKILSIMENGSGKRILEERPITPVPESPCGVETPHDWQPYTIQPFRDEVTKVVRHYIAQSSPRQLDLFPQERNACFHAVQYTTHPSTLLPAFLAAETALRTESYPKFAQWSLHNANRHRLVFLQIAAVLFIVFGLALDTALILSGQTHFLRIICIVFWWPALVILISAVKGICVFLHCRHLRALRPWEQFADAECDILDDHVETESIVSFTKADEAEKGRSSVDSSRSRQATFSRIDPLRKASLQAFGPKNDFQLEAWMALYSKKSLLRKVFEPTIVMRNKHLRLFHDRIVFRAVLWAGLVSTVLTVVSLFIPSASMF